MLTFRNQRKMKKNIATVNIKSVVDLESANQLFNYEEIKNITKKVKLHQTADIYNPCYQLKDKTSNKLKKNQVSIVKAGTYNGNQLLGRVQFNHNCSQAYLRCYGQAYIVDKGEGIYLQQGNFIKIGRLKYLIRSININNQNKKKNQIEYFFKNTHTLTVNKTLTGVCRFCLIEQTEQFTQNLDYLVAGCNCKGSCQKVHVNCLKTWLQQKIKRLSTAYVDFYNCKDLLCEICKSALPISVVKGLKGDIIDLIQIQIPKSNYMILEEITQNQDHNSLIIIKIPQQKSKKTLSIGRGNTCDIRFNDVSVSRLHSSLFLQNNRIVIKDQGSKYGTLVSLTKSTFISEESLKIQIKNIYFEINSNTDDTQKQN